MHGRHGNVKRHLVRHHGDVITVHDVSGNYTLIGQTYFHPSELRFHEVTLEDDQRIAFHRDPQSTSSSSGSRSGRETYLVFISSATTRWPGQPCHVPILPSATWFLAG